MLARGAVADVAEQAAIYARVLDAAGDRPVLFRTLDLGGDKLLPGAASRGGEPGDGLALACASASTGRRCCGGSCARCCWRRAGATLSVMFPMVATVAEFRAARALLLAEAKRVRPGARSGCRSAPCWRCRR